jgi:excisionase family DNA binding protein
MIDRLLRASEVGELLAVSERHVLELARRDEVPHVRIGRAVRFRPDAIAAWVVEREQGGPARFPRRNGPSR